MSSYSDLRVPVEVLERILFFAFTPLASPSSIATPSSPITSQSLVAPLLNTSHILLVSKGVRELGLPLYWSVVSIARQGDWERFLHPEHGLLVGHEDRTNLVKELWVNVAQEAQIPADKQAVRKALEKDEALTRILIELKPVALPNLDTLALFGCRRSYVDETWSGVHYTSDYFPDDLPTLLGQIMRVRAADAYVDDGSVLERHHILNGSPDKAVHFEAHRDFLSEIAYPDPSELNRRARKERRRSLALLLHHAGQVQIGLEVFEASLLSQLAEVVVHDGLTVAPPIGLDLVLPLDQRICFGLFANVDRDQEAVFSSDFPADFWLFFEGRKRFRWGDEWIWEREDGSVVNLKKAFEKTGENANACI